MNTETTEQMLQRMLSEANYEIGRLTARLEFRDQKIAELKEELIRLKGETGYCAETLS